MMSAWALYVNRSDDPDPAIVNMVNARFNPYRQAAVVS